MEPLYAMVSAVDTPWGLALKWTLSVVLAPCDKSSRPSY